MTDTCNILFIGDIMGKPGRRAIQEVLPGLREEKDIDCVVGNAENVSGGKGIQPEALKTLQQAGVDVFTSGNHVWDKKEVLDCFAQGYPLLRPANIPNTDVDPLPGEDFWIFKSSKNFEIAIINLMGRVFMDAIDCPFQCINLNLDIMKNKTPIVFVDMHCEATSEKAAMGWHLDGKVAAVVGSHTHVPTADGRILPKSTAFQTDAGMTGPYDSIIGMNPDPIVEKFLTKRPKRFEVAKNNIWFSSVMVTVDLKTGLATHIEPIRRQI